MFENSKDDGLRRRVNQGEDPGRYHHDLGSLLLSHCVDGGQRSGDADVSAGSKEMREMLYILQLSFQFFIDILRNEFKFYGNKISVLSHFSVQALLEQ